MIYRFLRVVTIFLFLYTNLTYAQDPATWSSGKIQLTLEKLSTLGSVLYVAAHPDDENTRLLSYLANERKYRTVYISITRGDGGQNLIGKEQGEELGMIRTQELLAARRVDGAEQVFARSNDFGYSKSANETFGFWDKESALADVVWAIRKYRPDVIINRFPTTGEGGHGHHTASAILALEAFRAAADPLRFPEQLRFVKTWQAKRIFHNSFNFRNQPPSDYTGQIKLDVGGYNPLLGKSYGEIAAESRSMHKSQGFGVARSRGVQFEHFKRLDGDTSVNEIFENINTGWSRIKGGDKIESQIKSMIDSFDPAHPNKIISQLGNLIALIDKIDDDYWKAVKKQEVQNLIVACSGLWFEANARDYYATPGDSVHLTISAISRLESGIVLESMNVNGFDTIFNKNLSTNELFSYNKGTVVSSQTAFTTPYWLIESYTPGRYTVKDQQMIGIPWNESPLSANFTFSVNGIKLSFNVPVNHKYTDPVKGEVYRPFEIVPPVSVTPLNDVMVFNAANEWQELQIKIKSNTDNLNGKLNFKAPQGWKVWALTQDEFDIKSLGKGKEIIKNIRISPPQSSAWSMTIPFADLEFYFETPTGKYNYSIKRLEYDHVPAMVLLKKSVVKGVTVNMNVSNAKIGYIEGAGDDVAKCLKQAGYNVEILDENTILNASLASYKAIITGIRAYNTIDNIDSYYTPLMRYVENGGNLIVQYNTNNFISATKSMIGPYPFKITRDRVTEENAKVNFIKPDHPILNHPNKISPDDFNNWVQERGLYFANELAPEYETVLGWNDIGEKQLDGGLIISKKGKGKFIYTGISFFRQLPAGVPGAYRLMVNLIHGGEELN